MKIKIHEAKEIVQNLFIKYGMPHSDAEELTSILISSHLKGYPSHGIARVPMYIEDIKNKTINVSAEIKVLKEAASSAHLDANKGVGPLQMVKGMELAIEKAEATGIGAVALKNSNDIARLGSYVEIPAAKGLIGLLFVNDGGANPAVCPTGTTKPFFSTNPLAAGLPTDKGWPIIIDISTATVALGRLKQAVNWDEEIPEGWIVEENGETSTDPASFFRKENPSAILPLGGLLRGHKGYALSLLVDILSGGLSGTGLSSGDPEHPESNGVFMLVLNPENFFGRDDLIKETSALIDRLKLLPGEVRIPGEKQYQLEANSGESIEIDPVTWSNIQRLSP